MLVLARRVNEKIVLPGLGVTIQVLQAKPNQVKLGIEAPPNVRVLRGELHGGHAPDAALLAGEASHQLANALNKLSLSVHLLEKQWENGQLTEAKATLAALKRKLEEIGEQHQPSKSAPPRKKPCTLVVEDDSSERQLLAGLLEMSGCDCPTAADGQEALDYLSQHERPDFVLMDLRLPRLDGQHAMRQIRENPRLRDLKIFAISNSQPQDTGPGGFDAWFTKPLNLANLLEAIQKNLPPPEGNPR